jgi:hypothetical protein
MNQMTEWVHANCRFASAGVGERAAQAIITAFAKAFKTVSAGRKITVAANGDIAGDAQKKENLISIAIDYLRTDPQLSADWQAFENRAKTLKAGISPENPIAEQDIAGLFQPINAAIAKVSQVYGVDAEVLKKKLTYMMNLDPKRPTPFAPGFVHQRQPVQPIV